MDRRTDAKPPLAETRILVVEDEFYLADDLARALKEQGASVVGPVGSLVEAQALIGDGIVDCAILDLNLRGEMAFPIADRLDDEGIPFVMASGYASNAIPERFGNIPHVEKPFLARDLVSILPNLLAGRR